MEKTYFDVVADEILEVMLSIPLLHELADLNHKQLVLFTTQFYQFVKNFPRYLGALIWKFPDENIRFALANNLVDEVGGFNHLEKMDRTATHPALFRKFASTLGLTEEDMNNAQPRHYTQQMLDTLDNLFIHSHYIKAVGGLAPGMESIFNTWIDLVLQGLRKTQRYSEKELLFFSLHTIVDEEHSEIIKVNLLDYLSSEENRKLLKEGAYTTVNAQKQFFLSLSEEIKALNHHPNLISQC